MVLRVENPETVSLIRELAHLRGQSITQAVTELLRREVERERRKDYVRRLQNRYRAPPEDNP